MVLGKKVLGIIKIWHVILAVVIAIATIVGYIIREKRRLEMCAGYLRASDGELARDNFDTALAHLTTAHPYCDDKDVQARELTVQTFKVAAEYDQIRLIRDNSVLIKTGESLRLIRSLTGENAELRVLQGILEELSDRPETALKQYEVAIDERPDYASAYNSWGYTIFKWKTGGSAWSDSSIEKFKQAASLDPQYAWPHLNIAAVYLELAENALAQTPVNLDDAKRHLSDINESLEKAGKLIPDNPRLFILWGHYYILQGQIFGARGLSLEANQNYYQARDKLIEAKNKNEKIADARVLLGSVYLELGMQKEALYELRSAVKLDDLNIVACARLVYCLSREPNNAGAKSEMLAEAKRGLSVIESLRQKFSARSLETKDSDAREWLVNSVKDCDAVEEFLKNMGRTTSSNRPVSRPLTAKSPTEGFESKRSLRDLTFKLPGSIH
jgi:tetratricopeptide (TPR) repeat protein